jgi:hypothetical protein
MTMSHVMDGNAVAGELGDVFVADMTVAVTSCATCGDVRAIAELAAYVDAPGTVLRCASCGAVQIRLVRAGRRAWLDLHGVTVVELTLHGPR